MAAAAWAKTIENKAAASTWRHQQHVMAKARQHGGEALYSASHRRRIVISVASKSVAKYSAARRK